MKNMKNMKNKMEIIEQLKEITLKDTVDIIILNPEFDSNGNIISGIKIINGEKIEIEYIPEYFWVEEEDYDCFRGYQIKTELRKYLDENAEEYEIWDDESGFLSWQAEVASQARHGSCGITEIDTLEELEEYFDIN